MDGADRGVAQRGRAHGGQDQDRDPNGRDSVPALRRPPVRPDRHPTLGHGADLRRRGADDLVDGVLPAQGTARDPRPRQMTPVRRGAWLRAMPAVFVLIWSTGFVVARLGMPHAPPMGFLAWRYALSIVAIGGWIALSRGVPWPVQPAQWLHLGVLGTLQHAGYLGGVWAAVKMGMPAGLAALIVCLQPVLTAAWLSWRSSAHRITPHQWLGLWLGLGGLTLVLWRRMQGGEIGPASLALAVGALLSITVGTLYQKRFIAPTDVRSAN